MKMKNNVVIILARGGSKSIPKKNIMKFCGKPLIAWSIEQAKFSKKVTSIWVSSENKEILNLSRKLGAQIIKRPKNLSNC